MWDIIPSLVEKAEEEDWTGRSSAQYSVLASYITFTYERVKRENKICQSSDGMWTAFNTGLLTPEGEKLFGMFEMSKYPGKETWAFEGWYENTNGSFYEHFPHPQPKATEYFFPATNLVYDFTRTLTLNTTQIMQNIDLVPPQFRDAPDQAMWLLENAKRGLLLTRLRRNYKLAVPQWDPRSNKKDVELLLPIDLDGSGEADLALVVSSSHGEYQGNSVLSLDMAYSNARLIARPDSEWLKP